MMTLTPKNTNTKSKKTKSKTKIGGKKINQDAVSN